MAERPDCERQQRLRIATFNLENLDDRPDLDPPLEDRLAILRPQLLRLEADVLCLQEVNGQQPQEGGARRLLALDRLLEGTPYADYHRASTTRPGGDGPADKHNLVVLSRFEITDAQQVRHELVTPPSYRPVMAEPEARKAQGIRWDRPIQNVTLALPGGRPLHVINLHLRATLAAPISGQKEGPFAWKSVGGWAEGFFIATVKRIGQALEARLLLERIFDHDPDALVVACGDFNAEEREMPLRLIRADIEDTGNGRLLRREMVPLEHALPPALRYSVLHHGHKVMLDHVLVSRALMGHYRHFEVHNEALGDELVAYATVSHSPESYHAPVIAEFAMPVA